MRNLLIHISDIHYNAEGTIENQGKVLNAFIEDLVDQVTKREYDKCFLVISGDLVVAGDEKENYRSFDTNFIRPIITRLDLPRTQIIVAPGNHDLMRNSVKRIKSTHHGLVLQKLDEKSFNDILASEDEKGNLLSKFANYHYYVTQSLKIPIDECCEASVDLDDNWSVLVLNSALLSEGGLDKWDDEKYLAIHTRKIEQWVQQHREKRKMLVCHHPANWFQEWARIEFEKACQHNFDIVLSGHVHEQKVYKVPSNVHEMICASAPQLFTDKYDLTLGYSLIDIDTDGVDTITYREWNSKRGKFTYGLSFTDDDDSLGVLKFREDQKTNEPEKIDRLTAVYEGKLSLGMQVYQNQPKEWIERYFTEERIDRKNVSMSKLNLHSETDIINRGKNAYIIASPDCGHTCLAYHFLLTLRKNFNKAGIYIKPSFNLKNFVNNIDTSKSEIGIINDADVEWIVVDDWGLDGTVAKQMLLTLKSRFPNAPILLMANHGDGFSSDKQEELDFFNSFDVLYLAPITRIQMRSLVEKYNAGNRYMEDGDKVLKRLDDDLRTFNMHRSPYNCITLLEVFSAGQFEEYPVNRTKVLERALRKIFEATDFPNYNTILPNLEECESAVGYFCTNQIRLIEKKQISAYGAFTITQGTFIDKVKPLFEKTGTALRLDVLFEALVLSGILVPCGENAYTFHLRTWAYYFAAVWMLKDKEFANEMLENKRYLHYPEIIEFYTGKTLDRTNALQILNADLSQVVQRVQGKFKVTDDYNPFSQMHVNASEESKQVLIESIKEKIQQTELPREVKDKMLDRTYNVGAPFNQEVYQNVVEYTVQHMFADIKIASKALRNSSMADKGAKQELLDTILRAWSTFAKVVTLVAKDFAQQGCINIDGERFELVEEYDKYNEQEKVWHIIENIPINIMQLFQDDLYSVRLDAILGEYFDSASDKIKKHLLACLMILKNPEGWESRIKNYIAQIGADSYYLNGTLIALAVHKDYGTSGIDNERKTNSLLRTVSYKLDTGSMPSSINQAERKPNMADVPRMGFTNMRNNKNKGSKKGKRKKK
jgi:predicted phosphodiesterase